MTKEKKKVIRNTCLLFLTALVWGVAFVAQSEGGREVGPYTFNCIRSILGGLVLMPVIRLMDVLNQKKDKTVELKAVHWTLLGAENQQKWLIKGGILCGMILFTATTLQQVGIFYGTQAGKAGFLTACYILLVPIFGLFLRKKCGFNVWVAVLIALVGLYFLCLSGPLGFQLSDLLVILCAICFSFHILVVDHYSPLVDGVRLSCIQFLTCGICGILPMFFVEMHHSVSGIMQWAQMLTDGSVWIPICYAGFISCGVGYTLQIIGQEGLNPTIAALIMSLESVFSVLAGAVLLHEFLLPREVIGCVILFTAIVLAQIPTRLSGQTNVS